MNQPTLTTGTTAAGTEGSSVIDQCYLPYEVALGRALTLKDAAHILREHDRLALFNPRYRQIVEATAQGKSLSEIVKEAGVGSASKVKRIVRDIAYGYSRRLKDPNYQGRSVMSDARERDKTKVKSKMRRVEKIEQRVYWHKDQISLLEKQIEELRK